MKYTAYFSNETLFQANSLKKLEEDIVEHFTHKEHFPEISSLSREVCNHVIDDIQERCRKQIEENKKEIATEKEHERQLKSDYYNSIKL
jgi:hypothetical protein